MKLIKYCKDSLAALERLLPRRCHFVEIFTLHGPRPNGPKYLTKELYPSQSTDRPALGQIPNSTPTAATLHSIASPTFPASPQHRAIAAARVAAQARPDDTICPPPDPSRILPSRTKSRNETEALRTPSRVLMPSAAASGLEVVPRT
ncbi:uncharacterized protein N7459_001569 [Penicillium hispanicum]|uniref:uncharacterized protein n=1 Tax=Penicillium hispanicum TaxID=1080232 RepID=UPI002540A47E|nr:uncharacterized protein N7459_001569 [Penicillium hispanicum]KAJ5595361.1 hypothetical protein N7459_001569 [Penicillium hispanicum]